jgi:hypothetical protein
VPGLVIGGGLYVDGAGTLTSNQINRDGIDVGKNRFERMSLGLLGPFVDYFIDPRNGWHVQGALGAAWMSVGKSTRNGVTYPQMDLGGIGFSLGGGYEWWVGKQWGLGVLLRGTFVTVGSNQTADERWSYHGLALPELLLSATYQ